MIMVLSFVFMRQRGYEHSKGNLNVEFSWNVAGPLQPITFDMVIIMLGKMMMSDKAADPSSNWYHYYLDSEAHM